MTSRSEVLKEVLSELKRSKHLLFIAPTGFGKSALLIHNLTEALDYWKRIIHVLPLRSIIINLTSELWKACNYFNLDSNTIIGYQAEINIKIKVNGREYEVPKDPYLLKRYIITTYDSYSLSLLVSPLPDILKMYAHGDVSYLAISSALNVFDEVHILTKSDELVREGPEESTAKSLVFLKALTTYFNETDTPTIYSTATLPSTMINIIFKDVGYKIYAVMGKKGYNIIRDKIPVFKYMDVAKIDDVSYEAKEYVKKIKTKISKGDIVKDVLEASKRHDKILVVVNTVPRAIELYLKLKNKIEEHQLYLIHSRFTLTDKSSKFSKIMEAVSNKKKVIVISTQVLEAGVNLSFDALISDIAPPESLIQRAGRVLRNIEHIDKVDEGFIIINISDKAIEKAKSIYTSSVIDNSINYLVNKITDKHFIDWRFGIKESNFIEFLEHVYSSVNEAIYNYIEVKYKRMLSLITGEIVSNIVLGFRDVMSRLRNLDREFKGSVIRDSVLIPLAVKINDKYDTVDTSLDVVVNNANRWLGKKPRAVMEILCEDLIYHLEIPLARLGIKSVIELTEYPLSAILKIIKSLRSRIVSQIGYKDVQVKFIGFKLLDHVYDPEIGLR